ncbi:hypothetical protein [Streptomyces hypolithicus]
MAYGYHQPTPEQIEAGQRAREQRIKDDHDEKLEEQANGGKGGPDRSTLKTQFMQEGIPELRRMVLDSNPDAIYEASLSWKQVHNILSGGDGDGSSGGVDAVSAKDSVAGMMQTAVDNVMEHWAGDAARAFQRKAAEITQKVRNGGAHANLTATQMEAVQKDLRAAKEKMRDVKQPSGWDSFWNRVGDPGRDDTQLKEDVKDGVSTEAARKANEEMLSAGKEAQLQGVAVMESLGANYQVYAKNMKGGAVHEPGDPFKPPSNEVTMPPPITMPSPSGSGPGAAGAATKPWSAGSTSKIGATPEISRAKGITGGSQLPVAKTNVDSISPGLTGGSPATGPSSGIGGPGSGGSGPGVGGPGGIPPLGGPGTRGGTPSGISGAKRTGIGAPGGGRSGIGGPGGAGAARGGARAGMGGMGGGAGAGAAGRGGAAAGGRGALAKARGGVIGAAKGPTANGTGAGGGLHGSRGGSQREGMAGGMGGAAGMGRGGRRSEDENSRGERPDYLVEDEETWVSEEDRKRNVPRNIE